MLIAHVIDGNDIGVLQRPRGLRFAIEAIEQTGIASDSASNGFQRHHPVNDRILGPVYDPEGPPA